MEFDDDDVVPDGGEKNKEEAKDSISPRSMQPSSSLAPPWYQIDRVDGDKRAPRVPLVPLLAPKDQLSDKQYYRLLYKSTAEDWGREPAKAFVHLMQCIDRDGDPEKRDKAWEALNRVCDETRRKQREKEEFRQLRKECQEKKLELRQLQLQLKERKRPKRGRTRSLSPRAFILSPFFGGQRPRSRSANSSPREQSQLGSTQKNSERLKLTRSTSSSGLPHSTPPMAPQRNPCNKKTNQSFINSM